MLLNKKKNGSFVFKIWSGFSPIVACLLLAGLISSKALAQELHFVAESGPPISLNGETLINGWCGALQAPQFSNIDIDDDGDKDLFVFDRYDNSILIFENDNDEKYVYQPDYQDLFPELKGWALLRDFNCDGKEDIFTSNAGGVAIYVNTSVGSDVSFALETSFLVSVSGPVLVPFADMPVVDDIDFDGDLDILAFDAAGSYIIYYKNMREEGNLGCNVIAYDIETICWGDFREGGLNNDVTLGDDCGGQIPTDPNWNHQTGNKSTVHSGSSISVFDYDGDMDMDALLGDVSANNMVFLRNGENSSDAIMDTVIDSFPINHPVDIYVYSAAYYLDVTFDGKPDLIIAPNEGAEVAGRNFNHTWLYEDSGVTGDMSFTLTKENFLMDQAVELGAGAIPRFFDYDNDEDLDLIIGNFALRILPDSMANGLTLYENVGTKDSASFVFLTSDFANTKTLGLFNTAPTFGDLDGDGDADMLLGDYSGKMSYFENTAAPGATAVFMFDSSNYEGLDVGSNATPDLIDLDRDGDLDLIVGERNGNINFFQNIGTASSADYILLNDTVGEILIQDPSINAGYTVPQVVDFDKDGKYDLIVGTYNGELLFYSNLESNLANPLSPVENVYYNPRTNAFGDVNYGRRSAPALADLNNDSLQELVFGLYRGGLIFLKNESDPNLGVKTDLNEFDVTIYPNPTEGLFNVLVQLPMQNGEVIVMDALGRKVAKSKLDGLNTAIDVGSLTRGMYIVIVQYNSQIIHKQKLLILD